MSDKKKSKSRFLLKTLFFLLLILFLAGGGVSCYALTRIGKAPEPSEQKFFATLANYRDGKFLNLEPVVMNTKKMAKGAGFFRFLFSSPNAPRRPYPRVELIRKSFPDRPEEFNVCWLGHSSLIFELGGVRFMVAKVSHHHEHEVNDYDENLQ